MAILTITDAAKAAGVSRTTIYDKINDGTLSRTSEGVDTAELLRVFGELKPDSEPSTVVQSDSQPTSDDAEWLRGKLDKRDSELEAARAKLADMQNELLDTRERLNEHREAARLLEHKTTEQQKEIDSARQMSERWKESLESRKVQIEQARAEAAELSDKVERETEQRQKAEAEARALESRGLIARLLNRRPETT